VRRGAGRGFIVLFKLTLLQPSRYFSPWRERRRPATAVKMLATLLVFPGRTSQGRMRSRALHFLQRDRRTASRTYPSSSCTPRSTHVLVNSNRLSPQTPQTHPARISPLALARILPYRVDSISSTCANTYLDGPGVKQLFGAVTFYSCSLNSSKFSGISPAVTSSG
jgi:hypothetical protein